MIDDKKAEIFLHILKAGGTTLWMPICREYGHERILKCNDYSILKDFNYTQHYENLVKSRNNSNLSLYGGHIPFGIHKSINQPSTYFTFFRDPQRRIISDYYHILRDKNHVFHSYVTEQNLSLEDYISSGDFPLVDNGQVRFLCGEKDLKYGDVSNVHLEKAKSYLLKYFPVWGLLELFDESLILIADYFGWSLPFYKRENVGQYSCNLMDLNPETIEKLESLTKYDQQLYDFAKSEFLKRIHKKREIIESKVSVLKLVNEFYNYQLSNDTLATCSEDVTKFINYVDEYTMQIFKNVNNLDNRLNSFEKIRNTDIVIVLLFYSIKYFNSNNMYKEAEIISNFLIDKSKTTIYSNSNNSMLGIEDFVHNKISEFKKYDIKSLREKNYSLWQKAYNSGYNSNMGDHSQYFYNSYFNSLGIYHKIESAKKIVEYGPGDGVYWDKYIVNYPEKQYYFVDVANKKIEQLKSKYKSHSNVYFHINYPQNFNERDIDLSFSFLLCQSMPKTLWKKHLKEVKDTLSEEGVYFFQFADYNERVSNDDIEFAVSGSNKYSPNEIFQMLEEAGFNGCNITEPINLEQLNSDITWYFCLAY